MMGIGKHDSKVWLVKAMCEASMRSHLSWGGLRWPRSVPLYYSRERQPELSCCMIFGGWLEEGLCVMLVAVVFFNYHDIDKAFSWPDIVDLLLGYLTLGGLTRAKREREDVVVRRVYLASGSQEQGLPGTCTTARAASLTLVTQPFKMPARAPPH